MPNKRDLNSMFILTFRWMRNELNLKNTESDVFAVIFGFSKSKSASYFGTIKYLSSLLCTTEKSISTALKNLINKGYIIKETFEYADGLYRNKYTVESKILYKYRDYLDDISIDYEESLDTEETSGSQDILPENYTEETSIDTEETSGYNINNNIINNSFLSKSNRLDLSKKLVHSEKCTSNQVSISDNLKENTQDVPVVYEKIEKNKKIARELEHDVPGGQNIASSDLEQIEVDKINALKLFKTESNKQHNKHKRDNEFTKCARLINANDLYSDKLKNLLYNYLKFRITRKGLTEDIWRHILSQLEEAINSAPTRDNDKLNYLREYVVNISLCSQYNTFYPINDRKLVELLSSYNPTSRGLNVDSDGIPIQKHSSVDKSKLAYNADGSPMIF